MGQYYDEIVLVFMVALCLSFSVLVLTMLLTNSNPTCKRILIKYCSRKKALIVFVCLYFSWAILSWLMMSLVEYNPDVNADEIVGLWKKRDSLLWFNENDTFSYLEKKSDKGFSVADGKWYLSDWIIYMDFNDEAIYERVQKKWRVIQIGSSYRVLDQYTGIDLFRISIDQLGFDKVKDESTVNIEVLNHLKNN